MNDVDLGYDVLVSSTHTVTQYLIKGWVCELAVRS